MKSTETINIAELRRRSVSLLKDVQEVLDAGGVKYWADFGTLLGAVREGRSIMWDGDFDLSTMEPDIAGRDELWNELRSKGYEIHIDESNIAITKKDWGKGWYKADLHRYREVGDGQVEYLFGSRPRSKLAKYNFRLMSIIGLAAKCTEIDQLYTNTPFDVICNLLIDSAGINPATLESIGDINYSHGSTTSGMDFRISHDSFDVGQSPIDTESLLGRLIYKFCKLLPQSLLTRLYQALNHYYEQSEKVPIKRVKFPVRFFEQLSTASFHDLTIATPLDTDEYLSMIYGENWRIPKTSWDLSTDSDIDAKEEAQ